MIVTCAIVAFAVLVLMFYVEKNALGVGLCVANLSLRVIEASRMIQLHLRKVAEDAPSAAGKVANDSNDPLLVDPVHDEDS